MIVALKIIGIVFTIVVVLLGVLFHYSIEQSRRVLIGATEDSTEPLPAGDAPRVRFSNALDHPIAQSLVRPFLVVLLAEFLAEDSILFPQVIDDLLLLLAHPACADHGEQLPRCESHGSRLGR